ncbi:MAG TPA: homocysteine S-methyltransferase family protein [Thermoleophilaceae bacterium]|jgi:homocysteine S-methyltransferase
MLSHLTDDRLYITDAGIETVLIFHHGIDLPCFASFPLLENEKHTQVMRSYFEEFIATARRHDLGMLIDTPTWRASSRWGEQLGYSSSDLVEINRRAVMLAQEIREAHARDNIPIVISGCIGPRDDAYAPEIVPSADDAEAYHLPQIATLAEAGVDMITALTLTNVGEAIGIVRASQRVGVPVAISFTVETDGRLPSGQSLREAVEQVDAETDSGPAYFMINCAHPSHFADALDDGPWLERIRGLRANASKKSHEELDAAEELDEGDPVEFGADYRDLFERLPNLTLLGGCCGTDHRHVSEACSACVPVFSEAR